MQGQKSTSNTWCGPKVWLYVPLFVGSWKSLPMPAHGWRIGTKGGFSRKPNFWQTWFYWSGVLGVEDEMPQSPLILNELYGFKKAIAFYIICVNNRFCFATVWVITERLWRERMYIIPADVVKKFLVAIEFITYRESACRVLYPAPTPKDRYQTSPSWAALPMGPPGVANRVLLCSVFWSSPWHALGEPSGRISLRCRLSRLIVMSHCFHEQVPLTCTMQNICFNYGVLHSFMWKTKCWLCML